MKQPEILEKTDLMIENMPLVQWPGTPGGVHVDEGRSEEGRRVRLPSLSQRVMRKSQDDEPQKMNVGSVVLTVFANSAVALSRPEVKPVPSRAERRNSSVSKDETGGRADGERDETDWRCKGRRPSPWSPCEGRHPRRS